MSCIVGLFIALRMWRIKQGDSTMTVHQKFVEDMESAGINTTAYSGRFFWDGPAARSDQQNGPTLQDIIKETALPLQWDNLDSNYIVYPVGKGDAEWNAGGADSENDEVERTGSRKDGIPLHLVV